MARTEWHMSAREVLHVTPEWELKVLADERHQERERERIRQWRENEAQQELAEKVKAVRGEV